MIDFINLLFSLLSYGLPHSSIYIDSLDVPVYVRQLQEQGEILQQLSCQLIINKLPSTITSMQPYQTSPLSSSTQPNQSPNRTRPALSFTGSSALSKSPNRSQVSPRKATAYTVHNNAKLRVFIKLKPPSAPQQFLNLAYVSDTEVEIQRQSSNNKIIYSYDRVFHETANSQKVFREGVVDVLDEVLKDASNGLIFVYGHTGTGKTFTMGLLDSVDEHSKGIVPQSFRYIFKFKERLQQSTNSRNALQLSLSFNEIYMDEVYDMLDFQSDNKLSIREHQSSKEPYIENNISIIVNTIEEAYQLLNIGLEKRRVGQQKVNKRSSRGHGIITISVQMANGKTGRLCFVDLAGSERIKESQSQGKGLKQAVHINSSLSALEALLMNIDEQAVRMYRGNKLTRLLQPFMESGKIRLFVTSNYENIQPIEFAKRCKGIKFMEKELVPEHSPSVSPAKSQKHNTADPQPKSAYRKQIEKLREEKKSLTQLLTSAMVMLSKMNKAVISLLSDQNTHSTFSLSNQYNFNLSGIGEEFQAKINAKINQLELNEEMIIDKFGHLDRREKEDDSLNTSVSNNKLDKVQSELQALLNCLPNEPNKLSSKLNEFGFGILQSAKQLASLCEYRNVYKKEMFTFAIKEELLCNKNKQLETAVGHLLKHCRMSENSASFNKILKELKEMGVEIGTSTSKNQTSKSKVTSKRHEPTPTTSNQSPMTTSPLSKSIPIGVTQKQKQPSKILQQFSAHYLEEYDHDNEQLFSSFENNANSNNKADIRASVEKNKRPDNSKNISNKNERKSSDRAVKKGGLILIEDL